MDTLPPDSESHSATTSKKKSKKKRASDAQHALEQAVEQANESLAAVVHAAAVAADASHEHKKKKKSRKREREADTEEGDAAVVADVDEDRAERKRHKKKRKHRHEQDVATDAPSTSAQEQGQGDNAAQEIGFASFDLDTNEDILRVLQHLDMAKIDALYRDFSVPMHPAQLADVALHASAPMPAYYLPPVGAPRAAKARPGSATLPPLATDEPVLECTPVEPEASRSSSRAPTGNPGPPPVLQDPNTPNHANLLAHRWMSPARLADIVKSEGLIIKKGRFTASEERNVRTAVENYRIAHNLTEEQLNDIIFSKTKRTPEAGAFYSELAATVPGRPVIAVYHWVKRSFHPLKLQGRWTAEEDAELKRSVASLGQSWEKISERVGRTASDCRDRYRNHILDRELRASGTWATEEEEELTRIVEELANDPAHTDKTDSFWTEVSQRMGRKRTRHQCRTKWTDSLTHKEKKRWSALDGYKLVQKVLALNIRDDTEIEWKSLPDTSWNDWSGHQLQRRFLSMKRAVKGHEEMAFQELMDILRAKRGQPPPPPKKTVVKRLKANIAPEPDGPQQSRPATPPPETIDPRLIHLSSDDSD